MARAEVTGGVLALRRAAERLGAREVGFVLGASCSAVVADVRSVVTSERETLGAVVAVVVSGALAASASRVLAL
jgi:hypothetical protein